MYRNKKRRYIMTIIKTFYKEGDQAPRAEVIEVNGVYSVEYYMGGVEPVKTEVFAGKSQLYAEDAAENWALGIETLNG